MTDEINWSNQNLTDEGVKTKLEELSDFVECLELDVSHNHLSHVPELTKYRQLCKLFRLKLNSNNIECLTVENIPHSTKHLDLSGNYLSVLPDLSILNTLTSLDLQDNRITVVDPKHLPLSVTYLHHNYNSLTKCLDFSHHTNISLLWLSSNNITVVDPRHIPLSVTKLYLNNNSLTECLDYSHHILLKVLWLDGNKIHTVHGLPKSLQKFSIDPGVDVLGVKCFHKETYELLKRSIEISTLQQPPPEVFSRGLAAVLEYYDEEGRVTCTHASMVLLGPTEAGKSSIVESLIAQQPVLVDIDKRTQVADIRTWHISALDSIQIYDEGGHEIYGITAPLFNTNSSIPLLVHDVTKIAEVQVEETISIFCQALKQHPENHVIVALTHIDKVDDISLQENRAVIKGKINDCIDQEIQLVNASDEATAVSRENLTSLLVDQRDKIKYFCVSCQTFQGMTDLTSYLKQIVEKKRVVIPNRWKKLYTLMSQEDLMFLKVEKMIIEYMKLYSGIQKVFASQKAKIASNCVAAVSYFRDIGLCLYFDTVPVLKNYVFHKPDFVIHLLQSIFDHNLSSRLDYEHDEHLKRDFQKEELQLMIRQYQEDGLLTRKLLQFLWKKYDLTDQDQMALLELMELFRLCYPVTIDSELLFFPWFVKNKICPDSIDPTNVTKFGKKLMALQFNCNFVGKIPQNVFEMMMVQLQKTALDRKYTGERYAWKDGLLIKIGTLECFAIRQKQDSAITFCVRGNTSDAKAIWTVTADVHCDLMSILSSYRGIVEAIWFLCSHCQVNNLVPVCKRCPDEVLHSQMPDVAYLTCQSEQVPRALVFAFSDRNESVQQHIRNLEEYLERRIAETSVPEKLFYLDCEPVSDTEVELSWGWPLCKLEGDPHGEIVDGTVTHAVVEYKQDECWKNVGINVEKSPYKFQGRASEFRVAAHNKNGTGDFQYVALSHVFEGDETVSEDDRGLMRINHASFCRMNSVWEVIIRLFSRGTISPEQKERLIRILLNISCSKSQYLAAEQLMEIIYRKTYQALYLFQKTLSETGQTVLAQTVPVQLVEDD